MKNIRNYKVFKVLAIFNMTFVFDAILVSFWLDFASLKWLKSEKIELKMTFDFTCISASIFSCFGIQLGPLLVPKTPPEPPRRGSRGGKKETKSMDF